MRKFLINILVFFAIFGVLIFAVHFFTRSVSEKSSNDYLGAIIDKHQRLASYKEPVLIFTGGSNLPYGINSELISRELKMPVVNLGLHGGLGLSFMLEEVSQCMKEQDVVILSIEYFLDLDGARDLKERVVNIYPEAGKFIRRNYLEDFFEKIISFQMKTRNNIKGLRLQTDSPEKAQKQRQEVDDLYSRHSFNQFGDVIAHLDKGSHDALSSRRIFPDQKWQGIAAIKDFIEYARSRNVRVFFMYPGYAESEYKTNEKVIGKLAIDLAANLKGHILGLPTDFVFADSLFFDSVYHLNKTGRDKRTGRIIQLLQPVMGAGQPPGLENSGTR